MITCKRIKEYLDVYYPYKGTLSSLSNNPVIKSQVDAYDFDAIKNNIYNDCCSADALLIRNNLNLIEFKTGFDSSEITALDKTKKENLKLKIKEKANDSLRILDIAIIGKLEKTDRDSIDAKIKKTYCAVIDVTQNTVLGDEVVVDIIADAGDVQNRLSYKTIIENSLRVFRKQTNAGEKLFYDETFVIYDYEFDKELSRFR